jgi:hypothetical protein
VRDIDIRWWTRGTASHRRFTSDLVSCLVEQPEQPSLRVRASAVLSGFADKYRHEGLLLAKTSPKTKITVNALMEVASPLADGPLN